MAVGSSKIGSFVWLVRLRHPQGLRYPTDVLLGTLILWVVLRGLGDSHPVWAIISCIVVSDRDVRVAWPNFVSRLANTLIGSVTGVICLLVFWPEGLAPAPGTRSHQSCVHKRDQNVGQLEDCPSYKRVEHHIRSGGTCRRVGFEQALRRAGEVLCGSLGALIISWVLSRFWPAPADLREA